VHGSQWTSGSYQSPQNSDKQGTDTTLALATMSFLVSEMTQMDLKPDSARAVISEKDIASSCSD
jgi:hypothetical protein